MTSKISLYECQNAHVLGDEIYCAKGHPINNRADGKINILALARGSPLELASCQNCPDFKIIGKPVKKEDRGWIHKAVKA